MQRLRLPRTSGSVVTMRWAELPGRVVVPLWMRLREWLRSFDVPPGESGCRDWASDAAKLSLTKQAPWAKHQDDHQQDVNEDIAGLG